MGAEPDAEQVTPRGEVVVGRHDDIVTISSAAGQTGSARQAHYSASKGAVIALTKAIALEYAAQGITANTIPPFIVDMPMLRAAQASRHREGAELIVKDQAGKIQSRDSHGRDRADRRG